MLMTKFNASRKGSLPMLPLPSMTNMASILLATDPQLELVPSGTADGGGLVVERAGKIEAERLKLKAFWQCIY